ncbi:MAG: leucine--tRNA ligase [Patescibacteria group bacterium]
MNTKYLPKQFENSIKELWEKEKVYLTESSKSKMYCLSMFPYPSGAGLHVGHVRIYTGTDVLARYFKMKGHNVLHPMGWDAFGLPAENAAIKAKKNPMDIVPGNIETFKRQMQSLGLSYDWSREFATTDPAYYRWTQWLFIQFFKMGLLYKKNTPINFCPVCKTGLAEEEVLANGTHERCGNAITKKDLPQWIFRITTYADRLLKDLDGLDWPEGILTMQRNWIGKKEGININYPVKETNEVITCFTTAPVNFGMTFIVIAPEHALVKKIINGEIKVNDQERKNVIEYYQKSLKKTDMDRQVEGKGKTGVFTGLYATNRIAGWDVPVWVAEFVVGHVGTGAVQGCPGHDYKDFEFAKKFNIPIIRVVEGKNGDKSPIERAEQVIIKGMKGKMMNSMFLNGLDFAEGLQKTMDYVEENKWGKRTVSYHLRDWIFSRQRYWGEPIPMVYCESCAKKEISWWDVNQNISKVDQNITKKMVGWFPLLEQNLPLELPYVKSYEPTDTGESPLSQIKDFVSTTCPNCGGSASRETDTMPNWAGSCWYFLKFASPDYSDDSPKKPSRMNLTDGLTHSRSFSDESSVLPWKQEDIKKLMPVDWYLGGAEHAVLHLLYARFWIKALQDLGLLDFSEPFLRLRNVGMVLAEDHHKMSKSLGNVINPDDVIAEFGADTLRIYEMFMAPFNMEIAWSTAALQGAYRFLNRIWQLYHNSDKIDERTKSEQAHTLVTSLQRTIKKVGEDISQTKFNTAIAAMMEFLNEWEKGSVGLSHSEAKKFLQILSPFAPFLAEKLWRDVYKEQKSVCISRWPEVKSEDLVALNVNLPVQVSGKVRAVITISSSASKEEIETRALQEAKVKEFIGSKVYKVIYVQGKILNFVLCSETTTRT